MPDLLIAGIIKDNISCNGCFFPHVGRKPFEILGWDVYFDIKLSGSVNTSKMLAHIYMLTHLDSFIEHPTIKGSSDAGAFKIQSCLSIHDFSHIPRGN